MKNTVQNQKRRKTIIVVAILIAVIASFGIIGSYFALQNHKFKISPYKTKEYQKLLKINEKHIQKAARENNASAETAIKSIEAIFERMRENIPGTVSELYSVKSKCKYIGKGIADKWPWSKKHDRLETMVESIFDKYLGSDKNIQKRLTEIEKDYARSLIANKNELLLNLNFDATVNNGKNSGIKKEKLMKLFDEQLAEYTGPMIGISLGGEVSSLIVSEAVTVVVINVVSSATGCAVSGAATFGIGVLVGVGVDLIVTKCAKEMMIKKLTIAVSEMEKVILNGTKDVSGVIVIFNQKAAQMTQAEEKAVVSVLKTVCR